MIFNHLGARPKKSSLKQEPEVRRPSFHQQSLEDALQLRNVTSVEDLNSLNKGRYEVARRIDRRLSLDFEALEPDEEPQYETEAILTSNLISNSSKIKAMHKVEQVDMDELCSSSSSLSKTALKYWSIHAHSQSVFLCRWSFFRATTELPEIAV